MGIHRNIPFPYPRNTNKSIFSFLRGLEAFFRGINFLRYNHLKNEKPKILALQRQGFEWLLKRYTGFF